MASVVIHPEVRRAMEAVELPEVLEIMQRLARFGLAIAVPHMHGEDGEFLPLPKGKVGLETDLQVSFRDDDDPEVQAALPVAWRCGWDGAKAAPTAKCTAIACAINWHGHRKS
jgi:hypothetical protein